METSEVLGHYQAIAGASQRMLAAARAADWDTVSTLERDCAAIIESIKQLGTVTLTVDEERRKGAIIRGLLADDAEIRNLAQPRLAALAVLIESSANQRRLERTYDN